MIDARTESRFIDVETARGLIDFGARIAAGPRVDEQLRGAVAIHNMLEANGVAYLADEVGFGKTFVALGALALFRHARPDFRVLVIAPRENIQRKWIKDFGNFQKFNLRRPPGAADPGEVGSYANLAELLEHCRTPSDTTPSTAALDGGPANVRCLFMKMTSFSLALPDDPAAWVEAARSWSARLGLANANSIDTSSKDACKSSIAREICRVLPMFDLVIVDEAHNLKHGYESRSSARNVVMAEALGRADNLRPEHAGGYGLRAKKLLLLSATPVEDDYAQLWNQLDLFGFGGKHEALRSPARGEAERKAAAAEFLVRRVTSMRVGHQYLTKNLYRREWREGGVADYDKPLAVANPRQQLIVALVQKKVVELLNGKQFNNAFQIGMLASFESFLQTAKLSRPDTEERDHNRLVVFDGAEQNDAASERERDGVDVDTLNRLAQDYRLRFDEEMPHPKMDAIAAAVANAWESGGKTLIFVRRVASVMELKRKLDERYDAWLMGLLKRRLPAPLVEELTRAYAEYRLQNATSRDFAAAASAGDGEDADKGGKDTFFAYFFCGDGPDGWFSGAHARGLFRQASRALSVFFAVNDVMLLLRAQPGRVGAALVAACGTGLAQTETELQTRARAYLGTSGKVTLKARFEAGQAAALELLKDCAHEGDLRRRAKTVWAHKYRRAATTASGAEPGQIMVALERVTFFSRLCEPRYTRLRDALWPAPRWAADESADAYARGVEEQALRADLLSVAARLGHSFIDLYPCLLTGRASLRRNVAGTADFDVDADADGADTNTSHDVIDAFLDVLERQRITPTGRPWGAFDELREIAANFDLISDLNLPRSGAKELVTSAGVVALLSQQRPVGGCWGGSDNQRLIRQFRMPGYPFALVATDVLQEGEDLHTFCSSVMHYGIAWTPSSMEQRTGRVDRVRSQTDRRLAQLTRPPDGEDCLQVYFPYLADTIEVLQVDRVLERMSTFLRLMHESLVPPPMDDRHIDLARAFGTPRRRAPAFTGVLESAFPLPVWALPCSAASAAQVDSLQAARQRFAGLRTPDISGFAIDWVDSSEPDQLVGVAQLDDERVQPFVLQLHVDHGDFFVRCATSIGRVDARDALHRIAASTARTSLRLCAAVAGDDGVFDLFAEDDVLLGASAFDAERVAVLLRRVLRPVDLIEFSRFDGRDDVSPQRPLEWLRRGARL